MAVSNYTGEEIIAKIIIKGGVKTEERDWMPRTVHNDPAGKDAFIIGNGPSRTGFDLYKLPQDSYGCNALYRDYEPDFLVCVDRRMYNEIKDSEYIEQNIVYTNHFNMSRLGGSSHLIPSNPHMGAGTTAMHIAIHDGHTNLICLGFDCAEDGPNLNVYTGTNAYNDEDTVVHQTVWGRQITEFIRKNPQIKWTFVEGNVPKEILNLDNVQTITYNELNTYIT